MRRRSTRWLSGALIALALAVPASAGAEPTRVFAVQPKLDLAWMESRETYHDKMFALFDAGLRVPGAPLVQAGAADVASQRTGRDLVAWPEDIGLFAALTGERAAPARASGSLEGSILTLTTLYGDENAYYTARFPELGQRPLPVRTTLVSLTDTFGRVALETFAEMADRYDVWLHAGVNMAQRWKVVCRDAQVAVPLPEAGCDEVDPARVQQLGDPFEPGRGYVYEATTADVSNMALLFDPDGRLHAKEVKTYITPVELPGQLDLVPGRVSDGLSAVDTPVGTLGFVTSKDAWMPDVVQKLDQRGVEILVQPEFFVNDLVAREGQWAPDTLRASGYNDMLRHPSIEALVLPELTGNIFNFSADAQSHIGAESRAGSPGRGFLVGQPPTHGLQVSPWVVPDPASPDEPVAERRARLAEAGEALRPGSGVACPDPARPGPCENGHVEDVYRHDVDVDAGDEYDRARRRRRVRPFARSRPVAPSPNRQRNAAMSLHRRRGVLVWEEQRGGRDVLMLARTRDHGRTWSSPRRPVRGRPAGADQWWPSVAMGRRGRVTLAWVERSVAGERDEGLPADERARVWFARSTDGGRRFRRPRELDPTPPEAVGQWKPSLAQGRGDLVHAAFVDERERSADDGLPQAHVFYTRISRGRVGQAERLDTGEPVALAAKLDNSWAPSVSAEGREVLVSWIDFVEYDWDVLARLSTDGGRSFGEQQTVNDTPDEDEALNDSPESVIGRSPWVAWTDWRKRAETARVLHPQYDTLLARLGGPNRAQDRGGPERSTFAPSACADDRDRVLVAFQDASTARQVIRVRARGGRVRKVDRPRGAATGAWRPEIGCWGRRMALAWEDDRDGPPQIYFTAANARRLRGR